MRSDRAWLSLTMVSVYSSRLISHRSSPSPFVISHPKITSSSLLGDSSLLPLPASQRSHLWDLGRWLLRGWYYSSRGGRRCGWGEVQGQSSVLVNVWFRKEQEFSVQASYVALHLQHNTDGTLFALKHTIINLFNHKNNHEALAKIILQLKPERGGILKPLEQSVQTSQLKQGTVASLLAASLNMLAVASSLIFYIL